MVKTNFISAENNPIFLTKYLLQSILLEKFQFSPPFRVNLQKYIGPKFAGRYGRTSCPYLSSLGFSNLKMLWNGFNACVRSLSKRKMSNNILIHSMNHSIHSTVKYRIKWTYLTVAVICNSENAFDNAIWTTPSFCTGLRLHVE